MLNALARLKKSSIRASDIASQYWCERQMELNYIHGQKITAEIKKGRQMHDQMESETNVPIVLMPKNYADVLYKGFYTSYMALKALKQNGRAREISVYGTIDGFKVVGKIDQLDLKDNEVVVQEDKTRSNDNIPGETQMLPHRAQVMLYRKLLGDIHAERYTAKTLENAYRISLMRITPEFTRQLESMEVERGLLGLEPMADAFISAIRKAGKLSDTLYIRYINQYSGKQIKLEKITYTEQEMSSMIDFTMKYWKGERESMPVPQDEKWKCNFCAFFGKECKVWWPQQKLGA